MAQPLVQFLDAGPDAVSAQTFLPGVRAEEIYAVVSSPRRHHELDGGHNVQHLISGPEHPAVGESTTQSMKLYGIPYTITATVSRAEPGRAFAWTMPGGHTWTWELFPETDDAGREGVRVRETFDAADSSVFGLPLAGVFKLNGGFARNRRSIALTLARLHRTFGRA